MSVAVLCFVLGVCNDVTVSHVENIGGGYATCNYLDCNRFYKGRRYHEKEHIQQTDKILLDMLAKGAHK